MTRSYFRGHKAIFKNGKWLYEDNLKPLPGWGGDIRPCKKCGKVFPLGKGEVDPCLGVLPGVDNACCGHGIKSESYIRFTNGVIIRGFEIEKEIEK